MEENKYDSKEKFKLSPNVSFFELKGLNYIYHNLFGYILQMSRDLVDFVNFFKDPKTEEEVIEEYKELFKKEDILNYIDILKEYSCIIKEDENEDTKLWIMFPVRSKWVVYYNDRGNITFYVSTDEGVKKIKLNDWQTYFWNAVDGNSSLSVIYRDIKIKFKFDDTSFNNSFLSFIKTLSHSSAQIIKFSSYPIGLYAKNPKSMPQYLSSFFPIVKKDFTNTDPFIHRIPLTFFYLFRKPHIALNNKSYGEALLDSLVREKLVNINQPLNVLDLSFDFGYYLKDLIPNLPPESRVTVLIRNETDLNNYKKQIKNLNNIKFIHGNLLDFKIENDEKFNLILINEILGLLNHIEISKDKILKNKELKSITSKYNLTFNDIEEDDFLFNVDAIKLLEKVEPLLSNDGTLIITEFGDEYQYPTPSTTSGLNFYLVHFGILKQVIKKLNLNSIYTFLIDFLNLKRDEFILSTNRHHFKALQEAFKDIGIELEEYPYTPKEIYKLKGNKEIGNLFFELIENRCFSIIPHQLKILICKKILKNEN